MHQLVIKSVQCQVRLPVCPRVSARLPHDGFSSNLILVIKKNCRENENWLKSDINIRRITRRLNSNFLLFRRLINNLQPAKSAKRKCFCLSVVTPLPICQQLYKVRHCWFFMATMFRWSSDNITIYVDLPILFPFLYAHVIIYFSFIMFFPLTAITFLNCFYFLLSYPLL